MPKSKDSSVQIAAIVATLLAVVGGAWLFLNNGDDQTGAVAEVSTTTDTSSLVPEKRKPEAVMPIDAAMEMAEMAFQAGQVAAPEDGSAMYFYRQILSQEPQNPRALAGMALIATQLSDEAFEQIARQDYEQVAEKLGLLNKIEPGSDTVLAIQKSLVERSEVLFASIDNAIAIQNYDRAEVLARRLRTIPDVDAGRVSAVRVSIANARKNLKAAAVDEATGNITEKPAQESAALTPEFGATNGREMSTDSSPADRIQTTVRSGGLQEPAQVAAQVNDATLPAAAATGEIISPDTVDTVAISIERNLATANTRVREGQLQSPEGDSALYYYGQVLQLDANNSEAKRGLRSLVQTMTSDALRKAHNGNWAEADEILANAAEIGFAGNLIEQTRDEVIALQILEESKKLVSIREFKAEKTVVPTYPRRAVSRSIEGWVTLEFVVSETGETRDIKVLKSSQKYAKQFANAAVSAVEKWRFEPRIFQGQAISQRSKTTVQFKLTD